MSSYLVNLWSRSRAILLAALVILVAFASFRQVPMAPFVAKHTVGSSIHGFGPFRESQFHSTLESNPAIDPVLVYSTLFGGTSEPLVAQPGQQATSTVVDGTGNVYVVGTTSASDFPVTAGVVQASNPSQNIVGFLAKFDPQGQLVFSTYLFGMSGAGMVAVDSNTGNIVVAGVSFANSNPTALPIPSGTTPLISSPRSISVIRLNSTATKVLNATYLGGTEAPDNGETLSGLALDSGGNVYIYGATTSKDFPLLNPIQAALPGSYGMFVTKLKPDLSALVYSTFLGQGAFVGAPALSTGIDSRNFSRDIAVDAAGDAYVTGVATSGFPTTSGAFQPTCTAQCAFVAKLNPAGSALTYSTFISNNVPDNSVLFGVNSIAVDASQNIFIAGGLWAPGFPTVNPVATCTAGLVGNDGNGFVAEISAAGALAFSTCLGQFPTRPGSPQGADFLDGVRDLVLDTSGRIVVTGIGSKQLPLQNPISSVVPVDADPDSAAFVAVIDPTTSTPTLVFSSLLAPTETGFPAGRGAIAGSYPNAVGMDSSQNIYVGGQTYGDGASAELPVFNAFQQSPKEPYFSPYSDAFLLKIAPIDAPAAAVNPGSLLFNGQGVGESSPPQAVTIFNMGSAPLSISNIAANGDFSTQGSCVGVLAGGGGGSCSFDVTFTPTATGNRTGSLTITDNSAGSPHIIPLSGAIGLVGAHFSPSPLAFPDTKVGVNFIEGLTLTNTGVLPLVITNVQVSGPFSVPQICTYLVGGASCKNFSVFFSPTTFGPAKGSITITDNAPDSPQVVQLTGSSSPSLGLGTAPSNFPDISVTAGASGGTELVVGGAGIGGSVGMSCSGAPAGATCSISPSTVNVSATTPSTVQVTVTTTARSHLLQVSPTSRLWLWPVGAIALLLLVRLATSTPYPKPSWCLVPLFALALCACGGGGSSGGDSGGGSGGSGTPTGNYTIVVTAKSGSTTQSLNLNLSVQ